MIKVIESAEQLNALNQGTPIATINEAGELLRFEFLMIHPHNSKYYLLLDTNSQDAHKWFVLTLLSGKWYIYTKDPESYKQLKALQAEFHKRKYKLFKELATEGDPDLEEVLEPKYS